MNWAGYTNKKLGDEVAGVANWLEVAPNKSSRRLFGLNRIFLGGWSDCLSSLKIKLKANTRCDSWLILSVASYTKYLLLSLMGVETLLGSDELLNNIANLKLIENTN